jgi:anti-sigma factor RsiW
VNITRDVANDLLPLYLAGEASADTRVLLEEFLRQNPEFARAVQEHAQRSAHLLSEAVAPLPPDHERATLERTRAFIRRRTNLLGVAIAFTLMPLAFMFEGHEVRWIMLRDSPMQALSFFMAALGCWLSYHWMGRRLRAGL